MTFTDKISGTMVTEFGKLIFPKSFSKELFTLEDIDNLKQTTAQWIFDYYNLVSLNKEQTGSHFGVMLSMDDYCKIAVMENHPDLEKEFEDRFGGNWAHHYIRFNH